MSIWFQILLIFLLILLNGFFAMSELSLMLARKVRLESMAKNGSRGARTALILAAKPARFLSTVQAGITIVGIYTGAISGDALAEQAGHWLASEVPALEHLAVPLMLTVVIATVGYLSLVSELVPKQLAIANPEAIAIAVAWPMRVLSVVAAPMVWLLETSIHLVLRLIGRHDATPQSVTEEEVRASIAEGARSGALKPAEGDMMAGVMRLADRRVRSFMTPRPNIHWLNIDDDPQTVLRKLRESGYSRLPVARGDLDELLGIVQAKDLFNQILEGRPLDIHAALHGAVVIHDNSPALGVLEMLRSSPLHLAVVVNEYGSVQGIITATDILQAIVGNLAKPDKAPYPETIQSKDGNWLIDGNLAFDIAQDLIGIKDLPSSEGKYTTVAGFVLAHLDHIPTAGEYFDWEHYRFQVLDMDGLRINKLSISNHNNQTMHEEQRNTPGNLDATEFSVTLGDNHGRIRQHPRHHHRHRHPPNHRGQSNQVRRGTKFGSDSLKVLDLAVGWSVSATSP
ncbi:putative hemolysin [Gammaproteobacteria bacterium]